MIQNDGLRASEQALAEQKKQTKRERAAGKRRKKTRDKHRAQGLEHTKEVSQSWKIRPVLKRHQAEPRIIVTDKLRSYGVAHRELIPDSIHDTSRYVNNRAELFTPTNKGSRVGHAKI